MDHHHKPPREFNFLSSGDFLHRNSDGVTQNNSKQMDLFSASANKTIQDPHTHNTYVHGNNGASTLPPTHHHDPPYLNVSLIQIYCCLISSGLIKFTLVHLYMYTDRFIKFNV